MPVARKISSDQYKINKQKKKPTQILYKWEYALVASYCSILTLLWAKCSVSQTLHFRSRARWYENMSQMFVLNNWFSYRGAGMKHFSLLFLNIIVLCKWIHEYRILKNVWHGFYLSSMYFIIVNNFNLHITSIQFLIVNDCIRLWVVLMWLCSCCRKWWCY